MNKEIHPYNSKYEFANEMSEAQCVTYTENISDSVNKTQLTMVS